VRRQHVGDHLLNKLSLFPYVLHALPIHSLLDLITLIISAEEQTIHHEGFVNKKKCKTKKKLLVVTKK
jgi:hypothetical protein